MISSVDDLLDLLSNQLENPELHDSPKARKDKWSASKIADFLNIKPDISEEVEGHIALKIFGANRFFAFDKHTIENIPECKLHLMHLSHC